MLTMETAGNADRESAGSCDGGAAGSPRRAGRWGGLLLVVAGLALLPWLLAPVGLLPGSVRSGHWATAWMGLDVLESLGLVATGLLLRRGGFPLGPVAAATAALLVVDAWFDTTTAVSAADERLALVMACGAELPLALLCTVVAGRAQAGQER